MYVSGDASLMVKAYPTSYIVQGSGDEAASFCFNVLDAGRRGLVGQDNFVAATNSCAELALHDQSTALQDTRWAEATAAGAHLLLDLCAKQMTTKYNNTHCKKADAPLRTSYGLMHMEGPNMWRNNV